nr:hypothetical protein [Sphingomonas sp. Y57]
MARKLKVFRTAIGFHDAYIAAPSRKAALEAWGSDHDLFATGAAELVTDPELSREPLEKPGTVVKRVRGTADEHLASIAKDRPKRGRAAAPPRPVAPRPNRTAVEKAEAALAKAEAQRRDELEEIVRDIERLSRRKRELEAKHRQSIDRLTRILDERRADYDDRLARWREER